MRLIAYSLTLIVVLSGCAALGPHRVHPTEASWDQVRKQIQLRGSQEITAGVAKVEITPPVGTPLAGYSKRRGKPSEGIRDPLFVRALVLSDGQDTVVLVSADLLVFSHPMAERLIVRIGEELSLPRQAIVVSTTHTHSGSGAIAEGFLHEFVFGKFDPEIQESMVSRILWAITQAAKNRKPVRWGFAYLPDPLKTMIENRAESDGEIDPSVSVFLLEDSEKRPLAMVVGVSAHPTLMDSRDLRFSADFPGAISQRLESDYPGAVCLFFNGATGDLRPKDAIGQNAEERIERFGGVVAEVASAQMSRMKMRSKGDLVAWGRWQKLPPTQMRLGPVPVHPEIGRMMRPSYTYTNLIALDEVVWLPLQSELTASLGLELKRKVLSFGLKPVPVGFANGYLGYAVTPLQYLSKSYEAWMTWYGPIFGLSTVEKLRKLAKLYEEIRSK